MAGSRSALGQVRGDVSCWAFLGVCSIRGSRDSLEPVGLYLLPRWGGFQPLFPSAPSPHSVLFSATPLIQLPGLGFSPRGPLRLCLCSCRVAPGCAWSWAAAPASSPVPSSPLHFPIQPHPVSTISCSIFQFYVQFFL